MRNILSIAAKDIKSNFVSPIAYVVIASYVFLSGFFFFTLLQQYNSISEQMTLYKNLTPNLNEWVVSPFYQTMEVVLIFLVPLLTMRSIAEEKNSGTFEMLITSPIKINDIVLGKTLAVWFTAFIMLSLSFIYPLVLIIFADPEALPILVGFLGLVLFAFSFIAIGIAVSSLTRTQTVAGVLSLVILLIFYVVDAPTSRVSGTLAGILKYLSPANHVDLLFKGVVNGNDLVFFFSVILFGLFLANRALDAQRWR
ncbi:MAG: ABC transporter permease subunit [Proteobacteria bacterium]|nr:ABC transporter permease subunit [Pseudomonadota bacterium]